MKIKYYTTFGVIYSNQDYNYQPIHSQLRLVNATIILQFINIVSTAKKLPAAVDTISRLAQVLWSAAISCFRHCQAHDILNVQ